MIQILSKKEAPIMEVPQELRGLSDEEIIKNSETRTRATNGKKRNGSLRPSKREREAIKTRNERQEAEKIAAQIFGNVPKIPHSTISEPSRPASGRVLKVSFGAKTGEKPKSVIVSAADLAKQKAEERAKKIQSIFKAKHPDATTNPDGTPIKRGRGRPRKNPI